MFRGLYLSAIPVALWCLSDVFSRYALLKWHIDPTVFVCMSIFTGAVVLLIVAGPGKLGIETLKQPHTWTYSFLNILFDIFFILAMAYISTTEASFLLRINIVMALFVAWAFLGRKPHKSDLIGSLAIIIGCGVIVVNTDPTVRYIAAFIMFITALLRTLQTVVTERHPTSNKADNIKDRCRISGYILLVTSFVFLGLAFLAALAKHFIGGDTLPILASMPNLVDFVDPATVISGTVVGVFVMSIASYFYFLATKVAKSETYLAVNSLAPVINYGLENIANHYGLLDITSIDNTDLIAGALIVSGAIYIVYMRHIHEHVPAIKAKRKRAVEAEKEAGNSDYDMLCDTLEFCNGCYEDAAKLLGITVKEVNAVYNAEGARKFQTAKGMDIGRNYHRNVASADPLTRLSKREVLMKALRGAVKENNPCAVMFIDLDKFKPVNDTYGHEAGNEILQAVAEVLNVSTPKDAVIARVGGDEFVIMLRNPSKGVAEKLKGSIKQRLSTPFQVPAAYEEVQIGASIGIANFPEDAETAKELMEFADGKMYLEKEER